MLPINYFKIKGHSMEPTFKNGERLWINRLAYLFFPPKEGDIVVFSHNNKFLVKRVSKVTKYRYFLSGDNKNDSLGSFSFGLIDKNKILGKVFNKIN